VERPLGTPSLVERVGECGEPGCTGDIGIRHLGHGPNAMVQCYPHWKLKMIAPAAELIAAESEAGHDNAEAIRVTADVVLFGEFDGAVHVLLIERGWDPFKGRWALPGGHVDPGEDTADAAYRELTEETGISVGALMYVGAYATVGRDPRGRYVTFAYSGRMAHRLEPTAGDDAVKAEWVRLDRIFSGEVLLAFDHTEILRDALRVTPLYSA
jgi:8-oxo-dGTP diphosphatase